MTNEQLAIFIISLLGHFLKNILEHRDGLSDDEIEEVRRDSKRADKNLDNALTDAIADAKTSDDGE